MFGLSRHCGAAPQSLDATEKQHHETKDSVCLFVCLFQPSRANVRARARVCVAIVPRLVSSHFFRVPSYFLLTRMAVAIAHELADKDNKVT